MISAYLAERPLTDPRLSFQVNQISDSYGSSVRLCGLINYAIIVSLEDFVLFNSLSLHLRHGAMPQDRWFI